MRKNKKIAAFLLAILMTISLCACSGDTGGEADVFLAALKKLGFA